MYKPQNKIIPVFSYTAEVGGGPLNAYTDWYCCRTCIALTSNIRERVFVGCKTKICPNHASLVERAFITSFTLAAE